MSPRSLTAVAAAAVATLSLFSGMVHAGDAAPSVTVPVDRYDLSKQSDTGALYARLQRAAREVCRPLESRDLSVKREHMACYSEALTNAVADIGDTRLTSLHESKDTLQVAARESKSRT